MRFGFEGRRTSRRAFVSRRDATHIESLSLTTHERHVLVASGSFPFVTSSGHLLFFRDGSLLAASFDARRIGMTGTPVRILENVAVDSNNGAPLIAFSSA